MSATWNVIEHPDGSFVLLNGDETSIRRSPAAKVDIPDVLSQLEELDVPAAYTRGLEEIYFSRHLIRRVGSYEGDVIKVTANLLKVRVLIHELGHHIDFLEDVTLDGRLDRERKERGDLMVDPYSKKDDSEYFAVGFEVYYAGNVAEKSRMRRNNPLLWKAISRVHERYQKR